MKDVEDEVKEGKRGKENLVERDEIEKTNYSTTVL